jgi:hypothetical protein
MLFRFCYQYFFFFQENMQLMEVALTKCQVFFFFSKFHQSTKIKSKRSKKLEKIFLTFFAHRWKDPDPGGPKGKNIRIRI